MTRAPVRKPIQERAQQRRASLLDATARVLDAGGYDALTTNAVALEAGASIGTVYQYFPSREDLLAGLLDRHRRRLQAAIDAAIGEVGDDPLAVADRTVDAFAEVWRHEPGYRAAWTATQAQRLLARTGDEWSARFTGRIVARLKSIVPAWGPAEARLVATTAVHLVSGLLLVAMTHGPRTEARLVAETKLALRAYLAARLTAVHGR